MCSTSMEAVLGQGGGAQSINTVIPLGILGGGVLPVSPNPDPISDQKMSFPIPVFRPDLVRD